MASVYRYLAYKQSMPIKRVNGFLQEAYPHQQQSRQSGRMLGGMMRYGCDGRQGSGIWGDIWNGFKEVIKVAPQAIQTIAPLIPLMTKGKGGAMQRQVADKKMILKEIEKEMKMLGQGCRKRKMKKHRKAKRGGMIEEL